MREKIIKLYKYDELNERAQEKARDWFAGIESEDFDTEFVYEDAATLGDLMGFDMRQRQRKLMNGATAWGVSIYYSGFSSQGDGACFEANWHACNVQPGKAREHAPQDETVAKLAAGFERIALAYPSARFSVKHRGHYYHELCTDFDIDMCPPEDEDDTARSAKEWEAIRERDSKLETELKELSREFMQWIYKRLESEYDYRQSKEALEEGIRANEYEFTEDGTRED